MTLEHNPTPEDKEKTDLDDVKLSLDSLKQEVVSWWKKQEVVSWWKKKEVVSWWKNNQYKKTAERLNNIDSKKLEKKTELDKLDAELDKLSAEFYKLYAKSKELDAEFDKLNAEFSDTFKLNLYRRQKILNRLTDINKEREDIGNRLDKILSRIEQIHNRKVQIY